MKRILKTSIAGILTIIAAVVFVRTFTNAAVYHPDGSVNPITGIVTDIIPTNNSSMHTAVAEAKISPEVNASYPKRLVIPSIGVNASFENVGTTANGAIGTPDNFTSVAWYDHSSIPGTKGTAIIDGHVDNGLGLAGVFKHLDQVQVGDKVNITTNGGLKLNFTVTDIAKYDYNSTSTPSLTVRESGSYIMLVTCTGNWLPDQRTYDERLVITAKLD
ncbi:MAG: class F sortase [Patescibacteria group bacterium]|nr:class F sortase [Patescibacteria group bacterium]